MHTVMQNEESLAKRNANAGMGNQAEDILDRLRDEAQDWIISYIVYTRREALDLSEQPI